MGKPDWAQQKQTDPPNFGEAQLVSEKVLEREVNRRKGHCIDVLKQTDDYCNFKKGVVSIVILSCKRLLTLQRLCRSMIDFFGNVETYNDVETILVDNGSGNELLEWARGLNYFDEIVSNEHNLGMVGALKKVFPRVNGEYILLVEDDFVVEYDQPFLKKCLGIFDEYPEIGIIRLKNQNNWWKPFRRISPLRATNDGTAFWTWLPSKSWIPTRSGKLNVWAAGSVLFRKVSYMSTGELPDGENADRTVRNHQGALYEEIYGKRFNRHWLAAKVKDCHPFVQPNDNEECPGWGEKR